MQIRESEKAGAFVISFEKRKQSVHEKDLEKLGEKLGEKLCENQKNILARIQTNKNITIPELAEKINISATAIENNIAKLKEKGLLKRIGPDKGGHWKIVKE